MARATTKPDLIIAANEQFEKLWKLVETMSEKQESHWGRDKNLRDVLVHLYEWHNLLITWIKANTNGIIRPFLPEPYNWRTYPTMNVEFWKKHQNTSLIDAKNLLMNSHKTVMKLIDGFSNDELFAKDVFAWTGTSPLGAYCVSATSSHYDWAIKKIKLHIKTSNK